MKKALSIFICISILTAMLSITTVSAADYSLALDEEIEITIKAGEPVDLTYYCMESGYYALESYTYKYDPFCHLYDEAGNEIEYSEDKNVEYDYNFCLVAYLYEDSTYNFYVDTWETSTSEEGSATFTVTLYKTDADNDDFDDDFNENYPVTDDGFAYEVTEDGTVSIREYQGFEKNVVIPETIEDYPVTKITTMAFTCCDKMQSVVIPDTVTSIDACAFEWCSDLKEVTLSDNLRGLAAGAFDYCYNLNEISLPKSLTFVGNNPFFGTHMWKEWIKKYESGKTTDLFYVDDILCDSPSYGSENLVIKEGTRIIACATFYDASNLKTIKFPSTLQYIGAGAFEGCTSLNNVVIPQGVLELGYGAFGDCTSLSNLSLADSIETIDTAAFYNCSNLVEVTLPKNFKGTAEQIFVGCDKLTNIHINPENKYFTSIDGVLYSKDISTLVLFPCGREYNPDTTPDTVTVFGDYSFIGNIKTKEFIFPENVKKAGIGMIQESNIEKITFPESIEIIDEDATWECYNLESVTILNPNCEIYGVEYAIYETATIYGYNNSTAQEYAENYERKFVSLGDAPNVNSILGDIDGDSDISVMDATSIQRYIAKQGSLTDEQIALGDTDKDGKISVMDATAIQRYVAKIIDKF